jgi:hypothetical protein
VARVLKGRDRDEAERFIAMRSHYGFDSFFCIPGKDGAHEKGGVEGEIGRFRRRHLVPVPRVASMAELNEAVAAGDARDDARRIFGRAVTVGAHFAAEAQTLRRLPTEAFDTRLVLNPRVDPKSRVSVRQCFYSVPARYVGRRVEVLLGADRVEMRDGAKVVAGHPRLVAKGSESLVLDHYLEVLVHKPGALPGSTALALARRQQAFTATHEHYWAAARRRLGDRDGTRALIEVLLAHRTMAADAVVAGMSAALAAGSVDPAVVLIEGRRVTTATTAAVPMGAELARFDRPAPTLAGYDTLLEA